MYYNGAFSAYTLGKPIDKYKLYDWLEERLGHPHWAVIPDVIGGSVEDNRKELRDDIQEAKNTAIQNVGGDIRTIGHLENNKIPDHKHLEESKCPPCPPCARCPEPSFSCKKVPNYASKTQDHLPRPVLNDFSSFAM